MKLIEQDKLEDGKSIIKLSVKNELILEEFPAIKSDIAEIEVIVVDIDERSQNQSLDNTGIAIDKKKSKNILAEEIYKHGLLSGSYFLKMGDMTNYKKVNCKLYKLKYLKPAELKIAATNMIKICTDNVIHLDSYKITTETIAKITEAKAAFEPLSNKPKEKRQEHKDKSTKAILLLLNNCLRNLLF